MKTITTVNEMKEFSREAHASGKTVGFVPTMGYLHEGHLSLIRASKEKAGVTVVSIFVNPVQFGPNEDLEKYPRDIERDSVMLKEEKVDVLFYPSVPEMYGEGYSVFVNIEGRLAESLCGSRRPYHFKGVATIVAKLFNSVKPDISFFGQKDAQQAAVIKRMVKDLDLDTDIRVMPIIREKDGLAMSSRNKYLSPAEREEALSLYKALEAAKNAIDGGETTVSRIIECVKVFFKEERGVKLDYFEIVDMESLEPVETVGKNMLIAVAAYVGKTRLIDNIVIE